MAFRPFPVRGESSPEGDPGVIASWVCLWQSAGMEINIFVVDAAPDFVEWIIHGPRLAGGRCAGAVSGVEGLGKSAREES